MSNGASVVMEITRSHRDSPSFLSPRVENVAGILCPRSKPADPHYSWVQKWKSVLQENGFGPYVRRHLGQAVLEKRR